MLGPTGRLTAQTGRKGDKGQQIPSLSVIFTALGSNFMICL